VVEGYKSVAGYRVGTTPPKEERSLSYGYLQLSAPAAHAQTALRESVRKNGANCVGREEEFSGEVLQTDEEAQFGCAGCPSFDKCDIFAKLSRPAHGTFAGIVHGRELEAAMTEKED
jgi:hypothetical protein